MITFKEILGTIPTPKDIWSTIKSHFNTPQKRKNMFLSLILLVLISGAITYILLINNADKIGIFTYLFPVKDTLSQGDMKTYSILKTMNISIYHISLCLGLALTLFSAPHIFQNQRTKFYFKASLSMLYFIGLSILVYGTIFGIILATYRTSELFGSIDMLIKNTPSDTFYIIANLLMVTILIFGPYIITCATLGLILKLLRFQSPKKVIATIIALIIYYLSIMMIIILTTGIISSVWQ